jgi:hypothetical protein
MTRLELLKIIIELSGSDADERGFYEDLAKKNKEELLSNLVELAIYYKSQYDG